MSVVQVNIFYCDAFLIVQTMSNFHLIYRFSRLFCVKEPSKVKLIGCIQLDHKKFSSSYALSSKRYQFLISLNEIYQVLAIQQIIQLGMFVFLLQYRDENLVNFYTLALSNLTLIILYQFYRQNILDIIEIFIYQIWCDNNYRSILGSCKILLQKLQKSKRKLLSSKLKMFNNYRNKFLQAFMSFVKPQLQTQKILMEIIVLTLLKMRLKIKKSHNFKLKTEDLIIVSNTQPRVYMINQIKNDSQLLCIYQNIIQLISTMSLLAQQLNTLKTNNSLKIAPSAAVPTFILDKNTARNTTIDVIYTMAILGYSEIKKQLVGHGKSLGEELLSEQYKQINRNKLNKVQNNNLSAKTTKFLLLLSPFLLNRSCQSIIEYMLRNFRVHVFEPEQLVLIFLQYWQHPIYQQLVANIETKNPSLSFIKELQSKKQLHFVFILKSITYSRNLLDNLIMLTKQYIRQEGFIDEDEIQIGLINQKTMIGKIQYEESSKLIKFDLKQFLLRILSAVIKHTNSNFIKDICQFCLFGSKQQCVESRSMSIILTISLLSNNQVSQEWIIKVCRNLLNFDLDQNLFNFTMMMCQRWPQCITNELLNTIISKEGFLRFLKQFQGSKCMLFYLCFKFYLEFSTKSHKNIMAQILQMIVLEIKEEQFMVSYENNLFDSIFEAIISMKEQIQKTENHKNSDDTKLWKFILSFIKKYLAYEYALFLHNRQMQKDILFGDLIKIDMNGKINVKNIRKIRCELKVHAKMNEQQKINEVQEQIDQQSLQSEKQVSKNKSLLEIVNKKFHKKYTKLDYSQNFTPQQITQLHELLTNYYKNLTNRYEDHLLISKQQKNRLFQNSTLFGLYDNQCFLADLVQRDYHTSVKYIMQTNDIQLCYSVFEKIIEVVSNDNQFKELTGDILYRELCRQAIETLANVAGEHYAKVVGSMAKLYHKFSKIITPENVSIINSFIMKISRGIFMKVGHNQGKIYKQLYVHSKLLAFMSQSNAMRPEVVQNNYQQLLKIYGWQNLYCILIGCIQQLAGKQKNNKEYLKFINNIILSSFKSEQSFQNLFQLLRAAEKMAIFSYFLIKEEKAIEDENITSITQQFNLAIAKKMIISFFGLQKPKIKRQIARKILIFISSIFKSQRFQVLFRKIIVETERKAERKISKKCTNIFKIFTHLEELSSGPLKQITTQIKAKVIILFPLQLRIEVLGPLLPSQELYQNLGEQLQTHSHQKFASLKVYTNVVPPQLSENYLSFIKECIKRQYIPSHEVCTEILTRQSQNQQIQQLKIELICALTQYAREQCLDLLPVMFKNIFAAAKQPNQYSLAIAHRLITNLKDYIHPYLDQLFGLVIQVQSQNIKYFIDKVAEVFTPPILLSLAKQHYKTVMNLQNFAHFLKKIAEKVNFDSLFKIYQLFCIRSTSILVQEQISFSQLHEILSGVFIQMTLKMNDNQLRKMILDLIRIGSQKNKEDNNAGLLYNAKKNLVVCIYTGLCKKLGQLFIHFYGYLFEELVKDIEALKYLQNQTKSSKQKRDRPLSQFALDSSVTYISSILKCLKELFNHDDQNQFMDSIKFDALAPAIASIFSVTKFGQSYNTLMNNYLLPCLLSMYKNTLDDYKLKTLNTQILRVIKLKEVKVNIAIFSFFDQVIDQIDHRFLLFTDQLTPILIEFSDSRNSVIKKHVESVIYKLQNISGNSIQRFVR